MLLINCTPFSLAFAISIDVISLLEHTYFFSFVRHFHTTAKFVKVCT